MLALDYRNWRRWFLSWPILAFGVVALPWYILCTLRNGLDFLYILFIQHQFDRFRTDALQHAQPWWFYGPVFCCCCSRGSRSCRSLLASAKDDSRTRVLTAVVHLRSDLFLRFRK